MSLKTLIDSDAFGELDESTQSLYQELDDGKYVLDVEGIDDHPSVQSLKSGHQRSKREREDAKRQADALKRKLGPLADLEDLDLSDADQERLEKLLPYLKGEAEIPDGEGGDDKPKKAPADLEKIKANARKPLERDLETVTAERDQLKQRFESVVVDNALASAITEVKVVGPYVKAVKAMFRDRVKVDTDDDGNTVALIDGEYGEQPVDKYLKDWAQTDEGKAFIQADKNGGGGANGGGGGAKTKNPWSAEHWNMSEQAKIYREDPARAERMAAEHGKKVGAR